MDANLFRAARPAQSAQEGYPTSGRQLVWLYRQGDRTSGCVERVADESEGSRATESSLFDGGYRLVPLGFLFERHRLLNGGFFVN